MCGIAGFSLHPDERAIDSTLLARKLLLAIEPRGKDATGAAWTEADGSPYYHKAGLRARDYVDTLPMSPTSVAAILHTRYGTGGSPKDNGNNHPFALPGITGIHNGVLRNHDAIFEELGVEPESKTDSEAIFALLAYSGLPVTEALEKIRGDATVAWIETERARSIHLARLSGRPLACGQTPLGSFVFASTVEMLRLGCSGANVRLKRSWIVPEGTYMRIWRGQAQEVERFAVPIRTYRDRDVRRTRDVGYDRWWKDGKDARDLVPAALRLGADEEA